MQHDQSIISFVEQLLQFSPRQGENEQRTAAFLKEVLEKNKVAYEIHSFATTIPVMKHASLEVDGKSVPCMGNALVSGSIKSNNRVISSLDDDEALSEEPNINYNPKCAGISLSYYYFAPALAIHRDDVPRVMAATKVEGVVEVAPFRYQSENILVGNTHSPRTMVIAHYDCLETGALDNASGVATTMSVLLGHPETLGDTLYVFSGNEELSYDKPTYWGYGFRALEKDRYDLFAQCQQILVVDGVGNGLASILNNPPSTPFAFPIHNLTTWAGKIFLCHTPFDNMIPVYHSNLDTLDGLEEASLRQAMELVTDKIISP